MAHQYKFAGVNYEGTSTTVLWHTELFTAEQFKAMVVGVMPLALGKMGSGGSPLYSRLHNLADIHEDVVDALCERHGFQRVEYAVEFHYFDWTGLNGDIFRASEESHEDAMVEAIRNMGLPPEFFDEWFEFNGPGPDDPHWDDPDYEFGLDAGLAFRLNEIAGRRIFTKVTRLPHHSDPLTRFEIIG
jgi:hypothetical protein